MAFGYALLKGRGGAAGHIRETDGKREISVRGLPGEVPCALYTWEDGSAVLRDQRKTDGDGNVRLTAGSPGRAFVTAADRVMLWEGGEDAYLTASAWVKKQEKETEEALPPAAETQPEALLAEAALLREATLPAGEREPAPPAPANAHPEKEDPPEQLYTLRPAGDGEPVDALPQRPRQY